MRGVFLAVLSDEFELVSAWTVVQPLNLAELTPFGDSGGSVLIEDVVSAKAAILVEVIEDGRVDGGEFLQT